MLDDQKHSQQKRKVANAVDDERFLTGISRGIFEKEESDQEIRREPHTFPAYEHQQIVVGQHQRKHEEHEQIQISKEAVISTFVFHVRRRVDVNQKAHARDDEHHHRGKLIEIETK